MFRKFCDWLYFFLGFPELDQGIFASLSNQLKQSHLETELWKSRAKDPRYIIEQCFTDLAWYDWNDERGVKPEIRRQNYHDAQTILRAPILTNIKNYLIATGSQAAVLEEQRDTNKIRDFQMTVNGIELLLKELENIKNPDQIKQNAEEPFSGI